MVPPVAWDGSGHHPLFKRLSFHMGHGVPFDVRVQHPDHSELDWDITEDELDSIAHPSSDWMLEMEFDGRAVGEPLSERAWTRRENFDKSATVRDVIRRIENGVAYGFFEGFSRLAVEDVVPVYVICWGT